MTTNINIEEDDEIIKRCLSGEIEAFRYLVEKYQIRIINTCLKYTKNLVDAEDVAQEVFLRAYDNLNNRLGYGGGFYDRYLNKYLKSNNNILTIGIAFSFQKYHKLPVSIEDVKLNYILTEKGIF